MAATLMIEVRVRQGVARDRVRPERRDEPAGREGSSGIDQDVPGQIDVENIRFLQWKAPQVGGYEAPVHRSAVTMAGEKTGFIRETPKRVERTSGITDGGLASSPPRPPGTTSGQPLGAGRFPACSGGDRPPQRHSLSRGRRRGGRGYRSWRPHPQRPRSARSPRNC